VVHSRPVVVARGGYYSPYLYNPWYYPYGGYGWYGRPGFSVGFGFGYGAYPYAYPYAYGPYPYYGYYGSAYYDLASSVRLEVRPREAQVYVDGYYAGVVDSFDGTFQRLRAEPGDHTLDLYLPGYRSVQQRLYLQPGVTSNVRLAMEPLAPGEPEPVRPEPIARPRSNDSGNNPDGGPQAVRPRPPAGSITVRPQSPPQGGVRAESGFGELALRVQPADAEVLIDGERWEAPTDNERLLLQLGGGVHYLEVRKDGYRSYMSDITVHEARTTTLNVALTRQ
jgi:hypothetical protein